jgi:YfiH family protein
VGIEQERPGRRATSPRTEPVTLRPPALHGAPAPSDGERDGWQAPRLEATEIDGLHLLVDRRALGRGVMVAFTDRRGGVSSAPFDSLNLAARVGDEPAEVAENRRRVGAALAFDPGCLALARQVHGARVAEVAPGRSGVVGQADVLVARGAGPVIAMLTADCAPVVLAGRGGVAVLHAGWRGLVAGVIEAGVAVLGPAWAAWIGPCIRACCYEVGPEVVSAFRGRGLPVAGEERVDLADAARHALREAGVDAVAISETCTRCDPAYFSYRRGRVTGRQGAFAAVRSPPA